MLAALGHLQTLLVPPRWGCISPKRTRHMGQMTLVLSEIPPSCKAWKGSGREPSPVRFLPPALLLQSLAPAFSSTPGDPPAPPQQPWLLCQVAAGPVEAAAPWPVVVSDAQRRRDAAARASFPSPSPLQSRPCRVQHLWGGHFPPRGAGP